MPYAVAQDGTRLFYDSAGSGGAVLFIHEFAGDHRSWEPQVRHFSDRYRCLTYAARGYPPSDVPEDPDKYSQAIAVSDAIAVLDAAGVDQAHIVGVSMGGFTALHIGMRHPDRVRSVVAGGCGYGAQPEKQAGFREECEAIAVAFETEGAAEVAKRYAVGPARVQFQNKDRRGWAEFAGMLADHSSLGSALTMRGVQKSRPSLYHLRDELAAMQAPTLVIAGDEDEGCLEPSLMLKRTIPACGLVVVPRTGHTVNLEEPEQFNRALDEFLSRVETGSWHPRDPRSLAASTTGMR
jgi:pimeloyl-ACP methyl ester carboxylesterase